MKPQGSGKCTGPVTDGMEQSAMSLMINRKALQGKPVPVKKYAGGIPKKFLLHAPA
jgi:hypothetical protein